MPPNFRPLDVEPTGTSTVEGCAGGGKNILEVAIVGRDDLRLWLAGPRSSAARPMPDGRAPEPGGWNRIVVEVDDLEERVERLKAAGLRFRNEIVTGPGGKQILLEDPAGNAIELFQPA